MYHSLFIHSPTEGKWYFGCFKFLVIIKNCYKHSHAGFSMDIKFQINSEYT